MKKDILSIKQFSKAEILEILEQAFTMKNTPPPPLLQGRLMASCFFEPSTRTRLSFEAAMKRLGGNVIGFDDGGNTASQKGETLYDAIKVIGSYADCIILRHPLEGAAKRASEATDTPVINAGDGANEHPTQTLLDLFSIQESQGKLEGLSIALVGDLKHGRTVHSLALALRHFSPRLYFVSPPGLGMPDALCDTLRAEGIPFSCHSSIEEVIGRLDILYMTRLQKERRAEGNLEILKPSHLERAKPTLKIFHPLPRTTEIDPAIDATPHAYYFTQAENGVFVRQALLLRAMGGTR